MLKSILLFCGYQGRKKEVHEWGDQDLGDIRYMWGWELRKSNERERWRVMLGKGWGMMKGVRGREKECHSHRSRQSPCVASSLLSHLNAIIYVFFRPTPPTPAATKTIASSFKVLSSRVPTRASPESFCRRSWLIDVLIFYSNLPEWYTLYHFIQKFLSQSADFKFSDSSNQNELSNLILDSSYC